MNLQPMARESRGYVILSLGQNTRRLFPFSMSHCWIIFFRGEIGFFSCRDFQWHVCLWPIGLGLSRWKPIIYRNRVMYFCSGQTRVSFQFSSSPFRTNHPCTRGLLIFAGATKKWPTHFVCFLELYSQRALSWNVLATLKIHLLYETGIGAARQELLRLLLQRRCGRKHSSPITTAAQLRR